jgi:hypothetical protein
MENRWRRGILVGSKLSFCDYYYRPVLKDSEDEGDYDLGAIVIKEKQEDGRCKVSGRKSCRTEDTEDTLRYGESVEVGHPCWVKTFLLRLLIPPCWERFRRRRRLRLGSDCDQGKTEKQADKDQIFSPSNLDNRFRSSIVLVLELALVLGICHCLPRRDLREYKSNILALI